MVFEILEVEELKRIVMNQKGAPYYVNRSQRLSHRLNHSIQLMGPYSIQFILLLEWRIGLNEMNISIVYKLWAKNES